MVTNRYLVKLLQTPSLLKKLGLTNTQIRRATPGKLVTFIRQRLH